jgi:predicted NAD/FAD-binding protein
MKPKKICIIGSGISGLTCAYYLSRYHEVKVYEANDYVGGHTHTIDVDHDGEHSRIDTGFIVFNDRTYPNFMKLMDEINVEYQPTEMSFSVRNDSIDLEYNGHSLATLFAQKKNLLNRRFWQLLWQIVRFNRDVVKTVEASPDMSVGTYLRDNQYGKLFADNYLLPMISAIWSMGYDEVYRMPLQFMVRFFENHGLLDLVNRPQWYTINGGSSSYIAPLTSGFAGKIHLKTRVTGVRRAEASVEVKTDHQSEFFDEVIMACHGDQALALMTDADEREREVLGRFSFTSNNVILHTDESILPKSRNAWASWNYRIDEASSILPTLTYNMNILQRLNTKNTYLVSLNTEVPEQQVLGEYIYSHPAYTAETMKGQRGWQDISGKSGIHFCGAYWFNGFHEDGVTSGIRVCRTLGVEP